MLYQDEADARLKQDVEQTLKIVDKVFPRRWKELINIETLEIASDTHCVVSQIYGSWEAGARVLAKRGVKLEEVPALYVPPNEDRNAQYLRYRALTIFWKGWFAEQSVPAAA